MLDLILKVRSEVLDGQAIRYEDALALTQTPLSLVPYLAASANEVRLKFAGNNPKKINILTVVKAADAGDTLAQRLLKEAGKRLGRKAAFLVNLFNPDLLIIGGGIEVAGAPFLDGVRDTVKKSAIPEATEKLRIAQSMLGENGVPLGSAAFVAQNYFINV